jgi:hypothetical protein
MAPGPFCFASPGLSFSFADCILSGRGSAAEFENPIMIHCLFQRTNACAGSK